MMSTARRGLGRGLSALFDDEELVGPSGASASAAPAAASAGQAAPAAGGATGRVTLSVTQLIPGPTQPRNVFDDATLKELAESISAHGVLQPLLVRPSKVKAGSYEIICGERRWRASQKAGLHDVPVIIRDLDDTQAMEIALIENIQRESLSVLDEAEAYIRLMNEFGHTQEKRAGVVGKSRSHIANTIRLMGLPDNVRKLIAKDALTAGHARALITAADPEGLARVVVEKGLSVRETERLAASAEGKAGSAKAKAAKPVKDVDTRALEQDITERLGMKMSIDLKSATKGTVKIKFDDLDQLDVIVQKLVAMGARGV